MPTAASRRQQVEQVDRYYCRGNDLSKRGAFDRAASYIRDRMIPSSNSLMLPFMPSSRGSFA